jgi:hypothetical protein
MIIDSDALIVENKVESGDCSSEGGLEGDPTGGDIQNIVQHTSLRLRDVANHVNIVSECWKISSTLEGNSWRSI